MSTVTLPVSLSPVRALRRETREEHEGVDRIGGEFGPTADGLRRFLLAVSEVVVPIENLLRRRLWPPEIDVPDRWAKGQWLTQDLGEIKSTPMFISVDDAQAWGTLYVIEGSTLGGQVLQRTRWSHYPSRYLGGYGERTAAMWQELSGCLDRSLPSHAVGRAVSAARATFGLYREALMRHV
jgi:heme oxygenase